MALINCQECNREISDKALTCPHCGCPISKETADDRVQRTSDEAIGKMDSHRQTPSPKKRKRKLVRNIFLFIVCVFLLIKVKPFFVNLGYEIKARSGDAKAQLRLARYYRSGIYGFDKDLNLAVKWYRAASEQGYADAQTDLAYCYYNGWGVEQDYAEAFKWFQKAAEQNEGWAQIGLGDMYYNGEGVEKDLDLAEKWWKKGVEQGRLVGVSKLEMLAEEKANRERRKNNRNVVKTAPRKNTIVQNKSVPNKIANKSSNNNVKTNQKTTEKRNTTTAKKATNPNQIVRQWSSNTAGLKTDYTEYADGRIVARSHNPCFACGGNATCRVCGGSRMQYTYVGGNQLCGMCGGTGNCSACQGKGENIVVSVTQNGNTESASPNAPTRHVGASNSNSSSSGLRYPEYQRYQDKQGRFDDRKYKEIRKAECSHCHGTGISPLALVETQVGSRTIYGNKSGNKCPHCGQRDRHWHNKCSSCS